MDALGPLADALRLFLVVTTDHTSAVPRSRTIVGLALVQGAAGLVAVALNAEALGAFLAGLAALLLVSEWAGSRRRSVRAWHRQNLGLALAGGFAFCGIAALTALAVLDWSLLRLLLCLVGAVICIIWAVSERDHLVDLEH